jgi:hypothetical protein
MQPDFDFFKRPSAAPVRANRHTIQIHQEGWWNSLHLPIFAAAALMALFAAFVNVKVSSSEISLTIAKPSLITRTVPQQATFPTAEDEFTSRLTQALIMTNGAVDVHELERVSGIPQETIQAILADRDVSRTMAMAILEAQSYYKAMPADMTPRQRGSAYAQDEVQQAIRNAFRMQFKAPAKPVLLEQ